MWILLEKVRYGVKGMMKTLEILSETFFLQFLTSIPVFIILHFNSGSLFLTLKVATRFYALGDWCSRKIRRFGFVEVNIDAFYFQNAEADKCVEVDFTNQTILFSSISGRGGSKIAEIRQMSGISDDHNQPQHGETKLDHSVAHAKSQHACRWTFR